MAPGDLAEGSLVAGGHLFEQDGVNRRRIVPGS
jgi:hypothetical protein